MKDDHFTAERQAWLRTQQDGAPVKPAPRFPYQPSRLHTLEDFKRRLKRYARQAAPC